MYGVVVQIDGSPVRLVYGEGVPARAFGADRLLSRLPEPSGSGFDPDTGNVTSSRMSLNVRADPTTRLVFLTTASRALTTLAAPVDESDTVITLAAPFALPEGSFVWLRDECLQVVGVSFTTVTVIRGIGGRTQAHASGTFVWRSNPYWRRRKAEMSVYRDGVLQSRWVGLVDSAPETSSDMANISLDLCGVWTLSSAIQGNRAAIPSFTTNGLLSVGVSFTNASSPVYSAFGAHTRFWQMGSAVFTTSQAGGVTRRERVFGTPSIAELGLSDAELMQTPIHELLVLGESEDVGFGSSHPVEIALLLLGVYPGLSDSWDPGLGAFITPSAVIRAQILAAQTAHYKVDHLVLGWDGAAFNTLETVRDLLRLWGFYLVEGALGTLEIVEYRVASTMQQGDGPAVPKREGMKWIGAHGGAADRVVARVGELPFRSGVNQELTLRQGQLSPWDTTSETLTIEAKYVSLANAGRVLVGQVVEAAYRRQRGQPQLRLIIDPMTYASDTPPYLTTGPPIIGQLYQLTSPVGLLEQVFPKVDGTLSASLGLDEFVGWLIGVRYLVSSGAYEVTFQLNNWALGGLFKVRAPSGEVETVTALGGGLYEITLSDRDWGVPPFLQMINWTVGQEVSFWSNDGFELVGPGVIDAKTAPNILSMTIPSGVPYPGLIIRLAPDTAQPDNAWNYLDMESFYA